MFHIQVDGFAETNMTMTSGARLSVTIVGRTRVFCRTSRRQRSIPVPTILIILKHTDSRAICKKTSPNQRSSPFLHLARPLSSLNGTPEPTFPPLAMQAWLCIALILFFFAKPCHDGNVDAPRIPSAQHRTRVMEAARRAAHTQLGWEFRELDGHRRHDREQEQWQTPDCCCRLSP